MSENTETFEIIDTDLYTGPEIEETEEIVLENIIEEVTKKEFGTEIAITAYKIANIINNVFKVTLTDKKIPTQMMYIYTNKGMIAKRTKGVPSKDVRYTKEEVIAFVTKYTSKHI